MKQSDKRLIRKVKRKARRAKVKTAIDELRENIWAELVDIDERIKKIEALCGAFTYSVDANKKITATPIKP